MGALDSPMRHRTGTVHYSVHATLAYPLGFGAVDRWRCLSSSCTGQSGATRTVRCPSDFAALTFARHSSSLFTWQSRSLAQRAVAPLAHRTVRWIIEEAALGFPESGCFDGAPGWRTGLCPVHHFSAHSSPFALIKLCF
jgi:hypothetical protein